MPVINDSTVVASAYTTSASARPQRLSNGWIVSAVSYTATDDYIDLYVSKDNGSTASKLCSVRYAKNMLSIASKGNIVYLAFAYASQTSFQFLTIDTTTVLSTKVYNGLSEPTSIDVSQTAFNGCSLAINSTGTELHACWSSKNATYPNSFNIRYAKGTISAVDGSVVWGTVQQIVNDNILNYDNTNPSIALDKNNYPFVFWQGQYVSNNSCIYCKFWNGTTWTLKNIYASGNPSYTQSSPSAIFVPQSINGLANGRIWVVWHGLDATETLASNIRVSYSDDNGVTWSAMQKVTTGNTYSQQLPSVTASKSGKIVILFQGKTSVETLHTQVQKLEYVSSWSGATTITSFSVDKNVYPSTIFDLTLSFIEPLYIYSGSAKVGFYGTWTTTTISVTQGSIGTKSDKSNLLTYAITTDGTMSTITESINGVVTNSESATSGQSLAVGLTQAQWDAIKYGKYKDATGGLNTLTVSMGTDTWTYTFDKRLATTDDINSAMKAVQDSQSIMLPSVKAKLGSAIRNKGGSVNDTDAWDTIVSAISGITIGALGGKKYASGTVTSTSATYPDFTIYYNSNMLNTFKVTVSGLTFKPSYIMLRSSDDVTQTVYDVRFASSMRITLINNRTNSTISGWAVQETGGATVDASGFVLPVSSGSTSYSWIAIE